MFPRLNITIAKSEKICVLTVMKLDVVRIGEVRSIGDLEKILINLN